MKRVGGRLFMKNEKKQPVPQEGLIEEMQLCCLCGEQYPSSKTRSIKIKGQKKYICNGCADTVHGLI
jgi:predicted SprT family Zn-dependent metalloprotease